MFHNLQQELICAVLGLGIIAKSLIYLCLEQVLASHELKPLDESPLYLNPRRLPPWTQNVVQEETSKIKDGRITPPTAP